MISLRLILLGAMASITGGCFDVHKVDPGRWLIDDFKSPDGDPTDPNFQRWACRPVDESGQIGNDNCKTTSIDSNHKSVLHLGATLIPGDSLFTRAELITYAEPNQDLTPYAKFWFSWKLVSDDPLLSPSGTNLKVQLTCTSVRDAHGKPVSTNPRVILTVSNYQAVLDYKKNHSDWDGWQQTSADLFGALGFWRPENTPVSNINQQDCLAHVDGIKVTVESDTSVPQPQRASFDLYVDDISLEPKE